MMRLRTGIPSVAFLVVDPDGKREQDWLHKAAFFDPHRLLLVLLVTEQQARGAVLVGRGEHCPGAAQSISCWERNDKPRCVRLL